MSMLTLLGLGWLLIAVIMLLLWAIQLRTRNAGTVDVAWSAGIGLLVLLFAALAEGQLWRRALVAGLCAFWSLRLAYYLFRRVSGEPEDGRYQRLRSGWGKQAQAFFFWFFQAQALLVVIFAIPPLIAMQHAAVDVRVWDMLAVGIWLIAIAGEALADRQLAAWRGNPANRGKTCRSGLWRYSRHPNYFFEWLHWFAYCAFAVGAPYALLTLVGPALLLLLLFTVTGIPPTEARALLTRGDDYRRYQQETSVFIPWFPRRATS